METGAVYPSAEEAVGRIEFYGRRNRGSAGVPGGVARDRAVEGVVKTEYRLEYRAERIDKEVWVPKGDTYSSLANAVEILGDITEHESMWDAPARKWRIVGRVIGDWEVVDV